MNKAEEQYLYQMGWHKAKSDMLLWSWPKMDNFQVKLLDYCYRHKEINPSGKNGQNDFLDSIINSIIGKAITDWPSFVTYMTGEAYE